MNNYANGKNDIKIFYEPKDIFVTADKGRISQVISNLISNAIKFTSKGSISILPSVRIKDGEQKEAIVSIKDTGQGIESDMLPKLFTKFTSKSFSGTGLGLYICKSIVESHGGKIWATNNTDRKGGATFTFTVPFELQTTLSVEKNG
jgi:signal transduction histidine kinase